MRYFLRLFFNQFKTFIQILDINTVYFKTATLKKSNLGSKLAFSADQAGVHIVGNAELKR